MSHAARELEWILGVTLLSVLDTDFLEHSDCSMFGVVLGELALRGHYRFGILLEDVGVDAEFLFVTSVKKFL